MNLQKKEKCSLRREMKSKVNELELTSSIFIDKDNRLHK